MCPLESPYETGIPEIQMKDILDAIVEDGLLVEQVDGKSKITHCV